MKLSNLILEEPNLLEENLLNTLKKAISKVGQFLKNTLKKVLEKLPFGKRTTIKVPIDYSVLGESTGKFGSLAGTYVEHATAYYLCLAMKEAGLNVVTDESMLEANMNKAYDTMVDAANQNQGNKQVPQKMHAGQVLGSKILDEVKDLPDLGLTQFEISQVGGAGEKSDLNITIIKPDLTRVIGISLKATNNTTDITGVDFILRAAARFFLPETLEPSGQFRSNTEGDKIKQTLPEFGKLQQEIYDKIFTKEESKLWTAQAKALNNEAEKKFGERTDDNREQWREFFHSKGLTDLNPTRPAAKNYHFAIKEKYNGDKKAFDQAFDDITTRFCEALVKKFDSNSEYGINWIKNQVGVDTDLAFYGYLSSKLTKGDPLILTTKHSPEFTKAIEDLSKGKIKLKIEKRNPESRGAQLYLGETKIFDLTFAFNAGGGILHQAKTNTKLGTEI